MQNVEAEKDSDSQDVSKLIEFENNYEQINILKNQCDSFTNANNKLSDDISTLKKHITRELQIIFNNLESICKTMNQEENDAHCSHAIDDKSLEKSLSNENIEELLENIDGLFKTININDLRNLKVKYLDEKVKRLELNDSLYKAIDALESAKKDHSPNKR